jgi:cytochrome c553
LAAVSLAVFIVLALPPATLAAVELADRAELLRLAVEGERWWTTSPDATNPVACATCHHDPTETREWASSYPKFRPLPPPHARVMTLLQSSAEAVTLHYRLADPRPIATAITVYLTMHGAGRPSSPGIVSRQPVFPARLRALARSVARGGRLYADRCAACHEARAINRVTAAFPRIRGGNAELLEDFLERHGAAQGRLAWESQAMADVVGYLVATRKEEP